MKYCSLCSSEYRQGMELCATCDARLVDSLASLESMSNPPALLWLGKDAIEFDLIAGTLRASRIPAYAEEGLRGLVGSLLKSVSKIHVLQSDLDRSLSVAADAIARRANGFGETQTCFACHAEVSAAFAVCPKCKSVLMVERKEKPEMAEAHSALDSRVLKYCPICDAEYRAEHERCSVCGVELVPEEYRGRPLTEKGRNERIEMVWRSGDPVAVSEAIRILRDEGIRHHVLATRDHLIFELGMPRPKYAIHVFQSDAETARQLLSGIRETTPFGIESLSSDLLEASELQAVPPKHPWIPAAATTEVWNGEDAAVAKLLIDCFMENRIGVRRAGKEPGVLHLLVMAPDEAAAREIIREVVEGSPLG